MGKSKVWPIYLFTWLLILSSGIWMYVHEGPYVNGMTIQFVPDNREIQALIQADGRNMDAFFLEEAGHISLKPSPAINGKGVLAQGKVEALQAGNQLAMVLVGDGDENQSDDWKILLSGGLTSVHIQRWSEKNIARTAYILCPILTFLILIIKMKRRKYGYAEKLLQRMERSEENQEAVKMGRAWFLKHERMGAWDSAVILLLTALFSGWTLRGLMHSAAIFNPSSLFGIYLLEMAEVLLLAWFFGVYRGKKFMELLEKEVRPLSSSVAYLMAGISPFASKSSTKIAFCNATVGLVRGGQYDEAVRFAESGWYTKRERNSVKLSYHNSLYCCFLNSNRLEEAKQQEEIISAILAKKIYLRPETADIFRLQKKIKDAAERMDIPRAEVYAEDYLERYKGAYRRLPVLYYMARLYEEAGDGGKADELWQTILQYSPENIEVKRAMEYGFCSYIPDNQVRRDVFGNVVRTALMVCTGLLCFISIIITYDSAGSGEDSRQMQLAEKNSGVEDKTGNDKAQSDKVENDKAESHIAESETKVKQESKAQAEKETEHRKTENQEEGIADFSLELPESWQGLYVEKELDGVGKIFYQKSSHERMGDGFLFAVTVYRDGGYVNEPDYEIWGYDEENVYVVTRPTDVSFYMEDGSVVDEYNRMAAEVAGIQETFRIHSETAGYEGNGFVFPNSRYCFLNESDLLNLSTEQLRIAKNEIYARHGRMFRDEELNRYFGQWSWYEGMVEPEAFDENVLNKYEKGNILLIQTEQEKRE